MTNPAQIVKPNSKLSGVLLKRINYPALHQEDRLEKKYFAEGMRYFKDHFREEDLMPEKYFASTTKQIVENKLGCEPRNRVSNVLALREGRVVGALYSVYLAKADALFVRWLKVSPDYEGTGLSRKLFNDAVKFADGATFDRRLGYVVGHMEPAIRAGSGKDERKILAVFGRAGAGLVGSECGFQYSIPVEKNNHLVYVPRDLVVVPLAGKIRMPRESAVKIIRNVYEVAYRQYEAFIQKTFDDVLRQIDSTIPHDGLGIKPLKEFLK